MVLDLDKDPGEENLNLRAYIASLVGPRRVSYGATRMYTVPSGRSIQIGQNAARDHEAVYLHCWLPTQALAAVAGSGGAFFLFSDDDEAGDGQLVSLVPKQVNQFHSAVLLPQDQLFARLFSDFSGAMLQSLPLMVAQVTF